jgi:hypothetical protein
MTFAKKASLKNPPSETSAFANLLIPLLDPKLRQPLLDFLSRL